MAAGLTTGFALGIALVSALLLWPFVHGWLKGLRGGELSIVLLGSITACSVWLAFHPTPRRNLSVFIPIVFCAILFWLRLRWKSREKRHPPNGPYHRSPAKAGQSLGA